MKKTFLRSSSPCITYLLLAFTGRTNIKSSKWGRLRDQVAGRPVDQIMRRSRIVRGTPVRRVF